MPDFATKILHSWDEFYEFVRGPNAESRDWIYRGQSNDWPLRTAIERALRHWAIDLKNATSIEFQTIREFRRRMREPQHHRVHQDTLYCLALMHRPPLGCGATVTAVVTGSDGIKVEGQGDVFCP
jgi:hypothetical protein